MVRLRVQLAHAVIITIPAELADGGDVSLQFGSGGGPNSNLANTNPYRYASGYLDVATGLYQFGQRYYQPSLGRWTQQDTLNTIGDPANGNRYTYTGDDPVNNIDPSGQLTTAEKVAVGIIVVGASRRSQEVLDSLGSGRSQGCQRQPVLAPSSVL